MRFFDYFSLKRNANLNLTFTRFEILSQLDDKKINLLSVGKYLPKINLFMSKYLPTRVTDQNYSIRVFNSLPSSKKSKTNFTPFCCNKTCQGEIKYIFSVDKLKNIIVKI